jgi:threonine/homoserine/homoserine lactone efflux protein
MLAAPAVLVVAGLVLSESEAPQASVWTFTGGAALLDVLVAVILYGLLVATGADGSDDFSAIVDTVLGVIFLALGVAAYRSQESQEKKDADRARIERVASGSLRTLLVAGVAVQVINSDAPVMFAGAVKEVAGENLKSYEVIVAVAVAVAVMVVALLCAGAGLCHLAQRLSPRDFTRQQLDP